MPHILVLEMKEGDGMETVLIVGIVAIVVIIIILVIYLGRK